jgi:hypothetical protein
MKPTVRTTSQSYGKNKQGQRSPKQLHLYVRLT